MGIETKEIDPIINWEKYLQNIVRAYSKMFKKLKSSSNDPFAEKKRDVTGAEKTQKDFNKFLREQSKVETDTLKNLQDVLTQKIPESQKRLFIQSLLPSLLAQNNNNYLLPGTRSVDLQALIEAGETYKRHPESLNNQDRFELRYILGIIAAIKDGTEFKPLGATVKETEEVTERMQQMVELHTIQKEVTVLKTGIDINATTTIKTKLQSLDSSIDSTASQRQIYLFKNDSELKKIYSNPEKDISVLEEAIVGRIDAGRPIDIPALLQFPTIGAIIHQLADRVLIEPYREVLLNNLMEHAEKMAAQKTDRYYQKKDLYSIPWTPTEIKEMQLTLAALHAVRGYDSITIDGILAQTLDAGKMDQLETTWFIYALELIKVVPNIMGILTRQTAGKNAWSNQKNTVLDFCRLYHPIRSRGSPYEQKVPRPLLQEYFIATANYHQNPEQKIAVQYINDAGAPITDLVSVNEFRKFYGNQVQHHLLTFYQKRLEQLQHRFTGQSKQATADKKIRDAQVQSVGKARIAAHKRTQEFEKRVGENGSFFNRITQKEADSSLLAYYNTGKHQLGELYTSASTLASQADTSKQSLYSMYETAFQMYRLTNDEMGQATTILAILLDCGLSYIQSNSLLLQVANNTVEKKLFGESSFEHKALSVMIKDPSHIDSLFGEHGILNPAGLDKTMMMLHKKTIKGGISIPKNGYNPERYDEAFGKGNVDSYDINNVLIGRIVIGDTNYLCDYTQLRQDITQGRLVGEMGRQETYTFDQLKQLVLKEQLRQDKEANTGRTADSYKIVLAKHPRELFVTETYDTNNGKPRKQFKKNVPVLRFGLEDLQLYVKDAAGNYSTASVVFNPKKPHSRYTTTPFAVETNQPQLISVQEQHAQRLRLLQSHPTIIETQKIATQMEATFSPFLAILRNDGVTTPDIINDLRDPKNRKRMKDRITTTGKRVSDPAFRESIQDLQKVVQTFEAGAYKDEIEKSLDSLLNDIQPVCNFFKPGGQGSTLLVQLDEITTLKGADFDSWFKRDGRKLMIVIGVTVAAMSLSGGLLGGVAGVLFSSAIGGFTGVAANEVLTHIDQAVNNTVRGRKLSGLEKYPDMTYTTTTPFEHFLTQADKGSAQRGAAWNTMISYYASSVAKNIGMSATIYGFGKFVAKPFSQVTKLGPKMQELKNSINSIGNAGDEFIKKYMLRGTERVFAKVFQKGGSIIKTGTNKFKVTIGTYSEEITEETLYEKVAEELLGPYGELVTGVLGTFKGEQGMKIENTTFTATEITNDPGANTVTLVFDTGTIHEANRLIGSSFLTEYLMQKFSETGLPYEVTQAEDGPTITVANSDGHHITILFHHPDYPHSLESALLRTGIEPTHLEEYRSKDEHGNIVLENLSDAQKNLLLAFLAKDMLVTENDQDGAYNITGAKTGEQYTLFITTKPIEPEGRFQNLETHFTGNASLTFGTISNNYNQTVTPVDFEKVEETLGKIGDINALFPGLSAYRETGNNNPEFDQYNFSHAFVYTLQSNNETFEEAHSLQEEVDLGMDGIEVDDTNAKILLEPGDCVLFSTRDNPNIDLKDSSGYSALYLGDGMYLCKMSPSGPLAVLTDKDIQTYFGMDTKYLIPQSAEGANDKYRKVHEAQVEQRKIRETDKTNNPLDFEAPLFIDFAAPFFDKISEYFPKRNNLDTVFLEMRMIALDETRHKTIPNSYQGLQSLIMGDIMAFERLALASKLLNKDVGREILTEHGNPDNPGKSDTPLQKRKILEQAKPGHYTKEDVKILFRRGVCGQLVSDSKQRVAMKEYLETIDPKQADTLYLLYQNANIDNLKSLLEYYPGITLEQLKQPSVYSMVHNYGDFKFLASQNVTLEQLREYGTSLMKASGLDMTKTTSNPLNVLMPDTDIMNAITKHSYYLSSLTSQHCSDAPTSFKESLSLGQKDGIILKGPSQISYTKIEQDNQTSLFYKNGKRESYGDLSDYYQKILLDIQHRRNFPEQWQQYTSLEQYLLAVYKDIKSISTENGALTLHLAEDFTYRSRSRDDLKEYKNAHDAGSKWTEKKYSGMLKHVERVLPYQSYGEIINLPYNGGMSNHRDAYQENKNSKEHSYTYINAVQYITSQIGTYLESQLSQKNPYFHDTLNIIHETTALKDIIKNPTYYSITSFQLTLIQTALEKKYTFTIPLSAEQWLVVYADVKTKIDQNLKQINCYLALQKLGSITTQALINPTSGPILFERIRNVVPSDLHLITFLPTLVKDVQALSESDRLTLVNTLLPGLTDKKIAAILQAHALIKKPERTNKKHSQEKAKILKRADLTTYEARVCMEMGICGELYKISTMTHEQISENPQNKRHSFEMSYSLTSRLGVIITANNQIAYTKTNCMTPSTLFMGPTGQRDTYGTLNTKYLNFAKLCDGKVRQYARENNKEQDQLTAEELDDIKETIPGLENATLGVNNRGFLFLDFGTTSSSQTIAQELYTDSDLTQENEEFSMWQRDSDQVSHMYLAATMSIGQDKAAIVHHSTRNRYGIFKRLPEGTGYAIEKSLSDTNENTNTTSHHFVEEAIPNSVPGSVLAGAKNIEGPEINEGLVAAELIPGDGIGIKKGGVLTESVIYGGKDADNQTIFILKATGHAEVQSLSLSELKATLGDDIAFVLYKKSFKTSEERKKYTQEINHYTGVVSPNIITAYERLAPGLGGLIETFPVLYENASFADYIFALIHQQDVSNPIIGITLLGTGGFGIAVEFKTQTGKSRVVKFGANRYGMISDKKIMKSEYYSHVMMENFFTGTTVHLPKLHRNFGNPEEILVMDKVEGVNLGKILNIKDFGPQLHTFVTQDRKKTLDELEGKPDKTDREETYLHFMKGTYKRIEKQLKQENIERPTSLDQTDSISKVLSYMTHIDIDTTILYYKRKNPANNVHSKANVNELTIHAGVIAALAEKGITDSATITALTQQASDQYNLFQTTLVEKTNELRKHGFWNYGSEINLAHNDLNRSNILINISEDNTSLQLEFLDFSMVGPAQESTADQRRNQMQQPRRYFN